MQENREWISMSDLMSGLMLIFLFIVVVFMLKVDAEKKEVEEIAQTYETAKENLKEDLEKEFENNLANWGAEVLTDGTVRFKNTTLLFEPGSSQLKPAFRAVLTQFFPRYIKVLEKFHNDIKEVRIEGHTSSDWTGAHDLETRYLNNVSLSQARSFKVLEYCFRLDTIKASREWLTSTFRANGLAFAQPIENANGTEDSVQSRRVEFKAVLKTEEKIKEILQRMAAIK